MKITEKLKEIAVYLFPALASSEGTETVTAYDAICKIYNNPQTEQIEAARQHGKGSELYEETKSKRTTSVRWAFLDPLRTGEKMEDTTGLMYLDLDPNDLPQPVAPTDTIQNNPFLHALYSIPYVVTIYRSFGGKGLGVLCATYGVTHDNHAAYYYDLSAIIFQATGAMCDRACSDPTRLNVLSSDPNIIIKNADWTPYAGAEYTQVYSDSNDSVFKKFNHDGESNAMVEQALQANGWKQCGKEYWTRPGKQKGVSAIFSYSGPYEGKIRVFSDNGGIEAKMYDKAELYKELTYNGDGKAFAKFLYQRYPKKMPTAANIQPPTLDRQSGYKMPDDPDEIDKLIDSLKIEGAPKIKDIKRDCGGFSVFPTYIANALETYAEASGLKREYLMHAALFAISALTQGKIYLNVNKSYGYKESPVMWGMSLGRPGDGKTPPHKVLLSHILNKIENDLNDIYEKELEEFDVLEAMDKKEREHQTGGAPVKKPIRKEIVSTDGTKEGYINTLKNTGSLSRYIDEISAFFSDLNAYRGGAGSDTQMYLQTFNRSTIKKNLVENTLYIKNPFMSITGTGVTENMVKIMRKGHLDTGMYERFTYWIPPTQEREEIKPKQRKSRLEDTSDEENKSIQALGTWNRFLDRIFTTFNSRDKDSPLMLDYTAEAIAALEQWEKWFDEQEANFLRDGKDTKASLYAKIRIYFYRLPIIFYVSRICGEMDKSLNLHEIEFFKNQAVEVCDIESTMRIIEYLISTYEYMHDELFNISDPSVLDKSELSAYKKKLALQLRDVKKDITTRQAAEAVERITNSKCSHVTVSRWFKRG